MPELHRLWEPGYKERYYKQKFGVEVSDMEFKQTCELSFIRRTPLTFLCSLIKTYVEGMAWVLHYYYQGVSCLGSLCPSL
jgi:5'-3' exoribonuclease 2